MAAHGKPKPKPPGAPAPPPPPPPPTAAEAKKGFMRRMFPFLLAVNAFVGAYMLVRTYYKDSPAKTADAASATATASTAVESQEPVAAVAPVKPVLPPIPEDEQRRVYKWMLEEKRKVKPRDAAEKKRLDDEKALLKQIIRADTLPVL
ncbi:hypothetical protein CFC21_004540 [Triticum aestivum]|uniref:Uncharacterized protein n=2 Tax=Triticum TaxID=4564 RepID=A0A9R0QHK1_TRITD|nr:uncharacterized protein LOC119295116 [Triticum dicoccoides]XP_044350159.1 uncharacterized protein LOC123070850 [Triticum aestivum]KAF6986823.1 hypothetical protein CFC21_004540 [Triticum aestivum]VAH11701.1 unnamed protein product [Triticum turgidum subsp. durum]